MTAAADVEEEAPKKSKMPLILGLVFAIVGGGGGFMAVKMGFIGGAASTEAAEEEKTEPLIELPAAAFVALDPLIVSLPKATGNAHLRFSAQLEVPPEHEEEVTAIKPRIVDVLNGYLRAVEISELEDPTALVRLRGQMLRRVQVVVGEGRIRDLLIMEFVLN